MKKTTKFEHVGNCTVCGAPIMFDHDAGEAKFYCDCRKPTITITDPPQPPQQPVVLPWCPPYWWPQHWLDRPYTWSDTTTSDNT